MPSESSKKVYKYLLLVFGLFIFIYVVWQGWGLVSQSKDYVTENSQSDVECVRYFFEVSKISANDLSTEFTIKNLDYSTQMDKLYINGEFRDVNLPPGADIRLETSINIETNLTLYPKGCSSFATVCMLESGECEN